MVRILSGALLGQAGIFSDPIGLIVAFICGACPAQLYEVRPCSDHRGVNLIPGALPFGRLWYDTPDHAIGYAMHSSRSHDAVIRVYDDAGHIIETHQHTDDFKEW